MKFTYEVLTVSTKEVDIDFEKVENYVSESIDDTDPVYIRFNFMDNICCYLEEIYNLYDIEDEDFLDSVVDSWEAYMDDKYGVVQDLDER